MPTPPHFGHLPDIPIGTTFASRIELIEAGLHRQRRAGVSGNLREGADAVVISGTYEDDVDEGDRILYTGQGGRDPRSGRQVADQQLNHYNRALVLSHERALPVRLIRGPNPDNPHAPDEGYRYDGLYAVMSYRRERGYRGCYVYRFELIKITP